MPVPNGEGDGLIFEPNDWISDWPRLAEVALGGVFFFIGIVAFVRILGKRTTGQMNNFDWIITVTVGALAASGILSRDISFADAVLGIVVLGLMQYATTLLVLRGGIVSKLAEASPTLLLHKGRVLEDAMRRTRISPEELRGALRQKGITRFEDANWVILETNGVLSVITKCDMTIDEAETLADVRAPDELPGPR